MRKETGMNDRVSFRQHGITLLGLLVVIVILVGVGFLLWPVFKRFSQGSFEAVCTNNLRKIGEAVREYADDFDGIVPPAQWAYGTGPGETVRWNQALAKYAGSRGGDAIFHCPAKSTSNVGYAVNYRVFCYNVSGAAKQNYTTMRQIYSPAETIYALDTGVVTEETKGLEDPLKWKEDTTQDAPVLCRCTKDKFWDQSPWRPMPRHNGKVNCLMMDGAVKDYTVDEILKRK